MYGFDCAPPVPEPSMMGPGDMMYQPGTMQPGTQESMQQDMYQGMPQGMQQGMQHAFRHGVTNQQQWQQQLQPRPQPQVQQHASIAVAEMGAGPPMGPTSMFNTHFDTGKMQPGYHMMGMPLGDGMSQGFGEQHEDQGISRTTVYVGNIHHADEAAIHNFFFANCGSITSIRMQANKGCCFVEFEDAASAQAAVMLDGTQVVLNPELPGSALHLAVRPAYDRPKRLQLDQRGGFVGRRRYGGRPRSPSPPSTARYSDAESRKLKELLKHSIDEIESPATAAALHMHGAVGSGGNLQYIINTLCAWMEAGCCDKKAADTFFVCLQHLHSKLSELKHAEEARSQQRQAEDAAYYGHVASQFDAALKAFNEARKNKVKDSFSKVQRKHVDRWVATATEGTKKYSSALGDGEDMDLEPQRLSAPAAAAGADPPAADALTKCELDAPPPPPPSGVIPPPPAEEPSPGVHETKRLKVEEAGVTAHIAAHEQHLVVEGSEGLQQLPPSVLPRATTPLNRPADAATVATVAALSVHLASFPQGAKLSQLCSYMASISLPAGEAASAEQQGKIASLVQSALTLAPGVFALQAAGGEEPMWSLLALQSLAGLVDVEQDVPAAIFGTCS